MFSLGTFSAFFFLCNGKSPGVGMIDWFVRLKQSLVVRGLLYLSIILILIYFFFAYSGDVLPIVLAKWHLLLSTAGLALTALVNQAVGYRHLLGEHGKDFEILKLLKIWAWSNLLNYLGPFQPGTIARSLMLKNYKVPFQVSAAASISWVFISIPIGALLFSLFLINSPKPEFLYFGIAIFVVATSWLALGGLVSSWIGRGRREGGGDYELVAGLRKSFLLGWAHFFALIQYAIMTATYFVLYRSFSSAVTVVDALGISTLIPLSSLLAITPNGVGIIESLITYFSFQFQLGLAESLFIIFITRSSHILACVGIVFLSRTK